MADLLSHLVDDVYGAALEPDRWRLVLDRLAERMGADHAHVFVADRRTMRPSFASVGSSTSAELLNEYHAHYHALDPRLEAGLRLPAGVLYPDHQLCDPHLFERSEFYNDYYRRCGVRFMAGCMLERTDTITVGFAVVRTRRQGTFSDTDLGELRALQPHLLHATRLQRRLALHTRAQRIGLEAFDRLALGIVILDLRGRAVVVNHAAREILAAHDGLELGRGGPQASTRVADGQLRQALAASIRCARREADAVPIAVAVPRASLARAYEVLIAPLPARRLRGGSGEAGVLVLISDPARTPEPPHRQLGRLYGLTPAEARVAAALAGGHTLARIADRAGYTREAARWHLKQIFQKTGTHRQAELVRLLRSGPLTWIHLDDGDG